MFIEVIMTLHEGSHINDIMSFFCGSDLKVLSGSSGVFVSGESAEFHRVFGTHSLQESKEGRIAVPASLSDHVSEIMRFPEHHYHNKEGD